MYSGGTAGCRNAEPQYWLLDIRIKHSMRQQLVFVETRILPEEDKSDCLILWQLMRSDAEDRLHLLRNVDPEPNKLFR